MTTIKLRILDEVSCVFVGLEEADIKMLYDKYGVFVPNYIFNPKYKLGQWDGKVRFFQKTGRTYLYLLEEILVYLTQRGYTFELEDLRQSVQVPVPITNDVFSHILHPDTGIPIQLRDDQVLAVNQLIEAGNGVCLAATGAGKTFMCAALVRSYDLLNLRSLTIVPDQSLIRQTKVDYINVGLDTGEYSGAAKTLSHRHVVSTWQALQNNPRVVEEFDVVIVDECHGLRGKVLQSILVEHCANVPYRYGFTGTLPKEETDRMAVHISVGPVRHSITAKELMDINVLAQLDIDIVQLEEDLHAEYDQFCNECVIGAKPTYKEFKDGYFPDFASEKSYIHRNTDRNVYIADMIMQKRDDRGNVLCLVDSISLGRELTALIPGAIFVNGQDVKKAADRQKIYDMFKDHNDLVVIATVHIAGTGLSIRRIFNLMLIDVGKSFTRVIQAIGRGLRIADDKDRVLVTDVCSDLKYGKKHLRTRIAYYKEAMYKHKLHKINYRATPSDFEKGE